MARAYIFPLNPKRHLGLSEHLLARTIAHPHPSLINESAAIDQTRMSINK